MHEPLLEGHAPDQEALRVIASAFSDLGAWRCTHVEPTGLSHTEYASSGQIATVALDALTDAGFSLSRAPRRE